MALSSSFCADVPSITYSIASLINYTQITQAHYHRQNVLVMATLGV